MAHRARWGRLRRRRSLAALSALMALLSIALSACANDVPPAVRATPLPNGARCGGWLQTASQRLLVSNPVTANGVVYIEYAAPTNRFDIFQSVIVALRASDGLALWRIRDPDPAQTEKLLIKDGMLILLGRDTTALRLADGKLIWQAQFSIRHFGPLSPDPPRGVLYVANDGFGLFAFRIADGALLWETQEAPQNEQNAAFPNVALTAPVLDGNTLFVGSGSSVIGVPDGPLMAFRADTGAMLWHTYVDSRYPTSFAPIAVISGVLYVKASSDTGPNGILRVNPVNGASLGFVPSTSPLSYLASQTTYFATASLVGDAYFFSGPPPFPVPPPTTFNYGLAGFDGHVRWRLTSSDSQLRLSVWSGNVLYLRDGVTVVAVRMSDGAVLWTDKSSLAGHVPFADAASPGYLFETALGEYDACRASDSWAPEIRALRSADGGFAWVDLLDTPLSSAP